MMCFKRPFWILLLIVLLLPGCGRKLDPETLALIEASDAVCLASVRDIRRIPAPEEEGWAYLLTCRVKEDYLGSLTVINEIGTILYWRPEVLLTEEEYRAFVPEYRERSRPGGNTELTLFLKLSEDGVTFVPAGENALRWGGPSDTAGIRLREALQAYGNKHPQEWLGLE
ncbi:MAG: hypothetical protein IKN89_13315 [Oscillospiraceae bacterium]|nr:hypothetical protein [Oscillospiraceae bacterium]